VNCGLAVLWGDMYVGWANLILSTPLSGSFCHHAVVVDVPRCMARGCRARGKVVASPRCANASASTRVLEHEHEHEHEPRLKETTGWKALVAPTVSRILCDCRRFTFDPLFHLIFPNISSLDPPRSASTIGLFIFTSILCPQRTAAQPSESVSKLIKTSCSWSA
jgi:hypothetical protein